MFHLLTTLFSFCSGVSFHILKGRVSRWQMVSESLAWGLLKTYRLSQICINNMTWFCHIPCLSLSLRSKSQAGVSCAVVRSAPHPPHPCPSHGDIAPASCCPEVCLLAGSSCGRSCMAECGGSHPEEQTRMEEGASWWHSPWKGGDGRRWGHGDMITEKGASEVTKATTSWITGLTICLPLCNQDDRHPQWVSGGG